MLGGVDRRSRTRTASGVVHDALVAAGGRPPRTARRSGRCRSSARRGTAAAQRHQRLPRPARARRTRRSRRRAPGRSPRAPSAAAPGWSATSSRAGSGRRRGSSPTRPAAAPSASSSRPTTASASWLRVDGVPVGEAIPTTEVPSPYDESDAADAARAALGTRDRPRSEVARSSSWSRPTRRSCPTSASGWPSGPGSASPGWAAPAATTRGDLFIAFATGNRHLPTPSGEGDTRSTVRRPDGRRRVIDPLFDATIEATEEAIVNALVAAQTMVGRDGITAHALPHDRLLETMARYGRPARPAG